MTELEAAQRKVAVLHHVCMELSGVIAEYKAMPCDSLERRMFNTQYRYKDKIASHGPDNKFDVIAPTDKERLFDRLQSALDDLPTGEPVRDAIYKIMMEELL